MSITLALALTLPLVCPLDDHYSECFKAFSEEHYRLLKDPRNADWEVANLERHGQIMAEVYKICGSEAIKAGVTWFDSIATVDKDGTIIKYMMLPAHPGLSCISDQMIRRQYLPPPVAPMYELATQRVRE